MRDKALAEGRIIAAPEEPTPATSKSPSMSWDITYYPLRGDDGDVAGILTFGVDVTERVAARRDAERRAEEERERAEEASFDRARLELAVEATDLGIWEWNVGTGETRWSERQKAIWGLDPEHDASYEYWRASIHPEDRDEVLGRVERTLDRESGGDQRMEHRIVRPDGGVRWIASRGRMIYDEKTGKPVRLIGTVRDVTERKNAEMALKEALASNEILLREVNHRIKNSLQLVSSMLSLQSLRSDDPEVRRLIQEAQSRVQVVAAVHERLYRSQDIRSVELDTFVETLCRDVERTMTEASDAIVVDVDDRADDDRQRPRRAGGAGPERAADERPEIRLSGAARRDRGEPAPSRRRNGARCGSPTEGSACRRILPSARAPRSACASSKAWCGKSAVNSASRSRSRDAPSRLPSTSVRRIHRT